MIKDMMTSGGGLDPLFFVKGKDDRGKFWEHLSDTEQLKWKKMANEFAKTSFNLTKISPQEKLYLIYHDKDFPPACPKCGKTYKFRGFRDGYKKTCLDCVSLKKENDEKEENPLTQMQKQLKTTHKDEILSDNRDKLKSTNINTNVDTKDYNCKPSPKMMGLQDLGKDATILKPYFSLDMKNTYNKLPPLIPSEAQEIAINVYKKDEIAEIMNTVQFIYYNRIDGIKIHPKGFFLIKFKDWVISAQLNLPIDSILKHRGIQYKYLVDRLVDLVQARIPFYKLIPYNSLVQDWNQMFFDQPVDGEDGAYNAKSGLLLEQFFHPSALAKDARSFAPADKGKGSFTLEERLRDINYIRSAVAACLSSFNATGNLFEAVEAYIREDKSIASAVFVPPAFVRINIMNHFEKNAIIFDPYCYYSSVMVASISLNNKFVGIASTQIQEECNNIFGALNLDNVKEGDQPVSAQVHFDTDSNLDCYATEKYHLVTCLLPHQLRKETLEKWKKKNFIKHIFFSHRPIEDMVKKVWPNKKIIQTKMSANGYDVFATII